MLHCRTCGGENADAANFCATCAAPLDGRTAGRAPAPAAAPRQERKLVTVVFCDLVGFTGRAEVMDPEDVRALLSGYHRRLRTELERHGATVEKFIGDAVVAVFGAPVVHEDDAERAVRAAIAIRDWAREQSDIEVRIAVNTGDALVSLDVDPASGEGMVAGDVINTAARIQAAAPVNGILVGEQTYRATRGAIAYFGRELFRARGKADPVTVWEVEAARSRVREGAVPHERSAFVGRERELAVLRDAFARMRDEREPQLVTLIAVPGAGKSRLVYELSRLVDAQPELVCWRQGQCLPYGDGVSFWALGEIVKAEAGVLESDSSEVAATKLAATVRAVLPVEDADWVERGLRPLIGLAEAGRRAGASSDESFPAWRRFLEALAERGPCVLVVEDLQWADEGLLDFLDALTDACAGLPMLLVATSRPELLARRPQWGGGKTNAATVSLPALSGTETARIVQTLLARPALSVELQRHLLECSGGNPLYAEEFARMLAERGDSNVAIPETVQGIIAARLDGLEPERKRLLQDAAVVGPTFWVGALRTLGGFDRVELEASLRQLEQREFIRRERRSSVEGEAEYAFRHGLVRDTAYGQIPRAERSERHHRTAVWIASLGRSDDHAELVAHHYLEAIRYANAASLDVAHLAAGAQSALRHAGERALRLAAYPQAARYLGAALEMMPEGAPQADRGELLYGYGLSRLAIDGIGEEFLVEAVALLRESGRTELAARAALLLARYAWQRVDPEATDQLLRDVDELTSEDPTSIARVEAGVARAGFDMVGGEYERAIEAATAVLPQLEGLDRPDLLARANDVLGTSRCSLGDEAGLDDCRRAIDVARAGGAVWEMHHAINNMINGCTHLGRTRQIRELMQRWAELFDEVGGTHYSRQWFLVDDMEHAYRIGDWDRALKRADEFLAGIPEGQRHYLESGVLAGRALILFARAEETRATADAQRAIELAHQGEDPQAVVPVICMHGRLMTAMGYQDVAEADWVAILSYGDALPTTLPAGCMLEFAWLAVDLGHRAEAAEIIDRCHPSNWTAAARSILSGDHAAAAEILDEMDQPAEAAFARLRAGGKQVHAALHFYESVGATRFVQDGHAQLGASA